MVSHVCRRTHEEVKEALDRGERLLILDVRQPADYDESTTTVRGARRIDPIDLGSHVGSLPRDVPIVTFCT